jgi:excisionase family DNA binding protein
VQLSKQTRQTPRQGLATVPEVAIYLNVSRATVYAIMDAGDLRYTKLGKCRRIPWDAVERLVNNNMVGATC